MIDKEISVIKSNALNSEIIASKALPPFSEMDITSFCNANESSGSGYN